MGKVCSTCAADNPDDARFCRGCGTLLDASANAPTPRGLQNVCTACGHVNWRDASYCAKCGTRLARSAFAAKSEPASAAAAQPPDPPHDGMPTAAAASPPPRPAPNVHASTPSRAFPDVDLSFATPAPPHRRALRLAIWTGLVALVLGTATAATWWYLDASKPAVIPYEQSALPRSAGSSVASQALPTLPVQSSSERDEAPESAQAPVEAPAQSSDASSARPAVVVAEPPSERPTASTASKPKRIDDDAQRREARAKREQLAGQRRREDERTRADEIAPRSAAPATTAVAAAPTPAPAPRTPPIAASSSRTAREICSGRNVFLRSICESRECASPAHANEPACREIKAKEERRRQPEQ